MAEQPVRYEVVDSVAWLTINRPEARNALTPAMYWGIKQAVRLVNALLADTRAAPWLTRHPEMPEWHLHLASVDDPLAQRMGAEMAMALADLIRAGELRRLKTCAAPDCQAVLIDLSRNRSRMFCDTGNCGNRQHVAAYRERRASDQVSDSRNER